MDAGASIGAGAGAGAPAGAGSAVAGVEPTALTVVTMQELLFSQPHPSPSESNAGEVHIAGPVLAVLVTELLVVELT